MGNDCTPKNLTAKIRAKGQTTGDIFTEAERLKELNGEQKYYYEKFMAKHYGIKPNTAKEASAWDAIKPKKGVIVDGQTYDRPSQVFSKKFYGAINKKMEAFEKGKDKSPKAYQEQIGKPVKTLIEGIRNDVLDAKGSPKRLDTKLAKYGLDHKTVYEGLEYLNWVKDGGHTIKSDKAIAALEKVGSNVAKAQAGFQMAWTAGNGVDMMRIYSHYLTRKPSSIANVIKGTMMALKETGGNPARRLKSLEKAGVYGSEYADRGGKNLSPFEWSVTAQKNVTYFLDKANGGNGTDGIRDLAFDSKPWDRPRWDRVKNTKLIFDLARYPINESRWLYKTGKKALSGDMAEQANLLIYGLAKTYSLGTKSLIPALAYAGMSKEAKQWFDDIDEKLPNVDMIRKVSKSIFSSMGMEGVELDLSKYTQPGGGSLGSRLSTIKSTTQKSVTGVIRGVEDVSKGNLPAAGVRGLQTASALANIGYGKYAEALSTMLKGANSTELTSLLDTMAKDLEGEFKTPDRVKTEVAKDLFGDFNIKKAN